jgi:transmembrane 9 superfamily protein 2/4
MQYVELYFIMIQIWMGQFSDVFGFNLLVSLLLCIACGELAILLVYHQLTLGNERWWWYAFFVSGSAGISTFGYSFLWFANLEASAPMAYYLYFGYMFLISFALFLVTGTFGVFATLWFLRKLYYSGHKGG